MIKRYYLNIVPFLLLLFVFLTPLFLRLGYSDEGSLYFDLVIDDTRQRIYAADSASGSVDVISINTLELITTVSVGGEPRGMDIDPTGNELAVALYSSGEIVFIDLSTLIITDRIVPAGASPNRPIDVLYGRPGRLYSVGDGGSGIDRIHIFDSVTKSEISSSSEIVRGEPRIAITVDGNDLFVSEHFSPNKLYRYNISTEPITRTHSSPHGPVNSSVIAISPDGEKIYTSVAQIWSGDLSTQLGSFDVFNDLTSTMVDNDIGYAYAKDRVFLSITEENGTSHLFELDGSTFQRLRSYRFDHPIKAPRSNQSGTKIFISTPNGILSFPATLEIAAFLPTIYNNYCRDFFDDFSNPASGWSVGEDIYVRSEYLNGEYRVLSKQGGYFYLFRAPTCDGVNYTVEMDARWQGTPGSSYGILFGIGGNFSSYYLFDINTDVRQFRLYRRDPSGFTQIVAPTYSPAINSGGIVNHLKVTRDGDRIILYANGSLLGSWLDNGIIGLGGVGLLSSSYAGNPTSDARFDNFSVSYLFTNAEAAGVVEVTGENHEPRNLENHFEPAPFSLDWQESFQN